MSGPNQLSPPREEVTSISVYALQSFIDGQKYLVDALAEQIQQEGDEFWQMVEAREDILKRFVITLNEVGIPAVYDAEKEDTAPLTHLAKLDDVNRIAQTTAASAHEQREHTDFANTLLAMLAEYDPAT